MKTTGEIAVVVPTIRPKEYEKFLNAWQPLFKKHDVKLVTVIDGDIPMANGLAPDAVMPGYEKAIVNFNGGVRNLGFAYVAKHYPGVEYIITLDDDETPVGDPIADHIAALNMKVPVSWMSTASEYTRGFPYLVRSEAPVVLSHGVWQGVADWDAPTQLVNGNRPITFPRMPIPKGVYFPMCCMNLAFRRCLLPYIYHAPWALDVERFDDIFAGIIAKRAIDEHGWAAVTGYAVVDHQRASNVYKNLQHEALGIELLETFWQGNEEHPYFSVYREKLELWQKYISLWHKT